MNRLTEEELNKIERRQSLCSGRYFKEGVPKILIDDDVPHLVSAYRELLKALDWVYDYVGGHAYIDSNVSDYIQNELDKVKGEQ